MMRNPTLDLVKGISIIFVIITHYQWTQMERLQYLFPFWIGLAVPIFMIISGYLYAGSFDRRGVEKLSQAYSPSYIVGKILYFTLPFSIIYLLEIFINKIAPYTFFELRDFSHALISTFLQGGIGPGSYYYPLMIQFIFLYPVIYFLIKKYHSLGFLLCLGMNIAYEILQWSYHMLGQTYRLLIFRYILLIAFGSYLYQIGEKKIKRRWSILSILIGGGFLLLTEYIGYETKILIYWTRTSWLGSLFVLPIMAYTIQKIRISNPILELFGKASYHIFLVQMAYYGFFRQYMYRAIPQRWIQLALSLSFTLVVGVLFYYLEDPLNKKILLEVKKWLKKVEAIHWREKINKHFLQG